MISVKENDKCFKLSGFINYKDYYDKGAKVWSIHLGIADIYLFDKSLMLYGIEKPPRNFGE